MAKAFVIIFTVFMTYSMIGKKDQTVVAITELYVSVITWYFITNLKSKQHWTVSFGLVLKQATNRPLEMTQPLHFYNTSYHDT
jgi:lipoprotein signal peptidase